jgi:hypothetical protein
LTNEGNRERKSQNKKIHIANSEAPIDHFALQCAHRIPRIFL